MHRFEGHHLESRENKHFMLFYTPRGPHEDSHDSAHGKSDSAHENVHESVLGQFSHVRFLPMKGKGKADKAITARMITKPSFEKLTFRC